MSNFEKIYIAKVIKNARKNKGLKQSQLAEITGISEKHLSKIETGKNYPSLDNFLKIVEVLQISLEDLGINNSADTTEEKEELLQIINTASAAQIKAYLDIIKSAQKHIR